MRPTLVIGKNLLIAPEKIGESTIPSLGEMLNVQNKEEAKNRLSEDEGLFIGFGKIKSCYPYKEQNQYTTKLVERPVNTAVLENKYLKATFLTEYGGRLWELIDKETGRNLLYTNDVIQPRNLAIRNAWFSGGVEWNIGAIGHSPFTCEQLYVADTLRDDGIPILRMYEYERIRQVTFQMDFWLEEESDILFCRMRIDNRNKEMVPMYWWSNIAVPEHEGGRIIVPAESAYKNSVKPGIGKVSIPHDPECDKDITYYNGIKEPVDYFFDINAENRKYIANLDHTGFGLLQFSSQRLQGRKLFSWGHLQGSDNWQRILTKDAGKYIEIQAGVAKTQYECIPMPPETAWEWIEGYTSIKLPQDKVFNGYNTAVESASKHVDNIWNVFDLDTLVKETKESIGKKVFDLKVKGSAYGYIDHMLRLEKQKAGVSDHLEFKASRAQEWLTLLKMGDLKRVSALEEPASFQISQSWRILLEESVKHKGKDNWYAWYQLGIMYAHEDNFDKAVTCLQQSILLDVNPWAYHALAYIYMVSNEMDLAIRYARKAITMKPDDYSLVENLMKLLLNEESFQEVISLYDMLHKRVQEVGRMKMYLSFAHAKLGHLQEAADLMNNQGGLKVDDIREGEVSITDLWILIHKLLNPTVEEENIQVPMAYDFRMHG